MSLFYVEKTGGGRLCEFETIWFGAGKISRPVQLKFGSLTFFAFPSKAVMTPCLQVTEKQGVMTALESVSPLFCKKLSKNPMINETKLRFCPTISIVGNEINELP